MTRPWPHETIAVPQRIDGWRVVAAAKLPSGVGPDRYVVVVEAMGTAGFIFHAEVTWRPSTGFKPATATGSGIIAYRDAMYLFSVAMTRAVELMAGTDM